MNFEVTDFNKDVIEASYDQPVLVDFWAEWCGPCRILGPVLEKLAEKSDDWKLVKVNSDEYPELSSEFGIRSIPNVKMFSKGKVVNEFVGALPEPAVVDWLKKNIPSKFSEFISEAENYLNKGDESKASKILENVLKSDPNNTSAKILLAKIYLFDDTSKTSDLINIIGESGEHQEMIDSIKTISNLLTDHTEQIFEDTPTKIQILSAINHLQSKNFDSALEIFIEVIKNDRYYGDDIARKACIAIFKYLGEENETTLKFRREFGRALYI